MNDSYMIDYHTILIHFDAFLDTSLRDQLTKRVRELRIRDRLLQDNPSLKVCLKIAKRMDAGFLHLPYSKIRNSLKLCLVLLTLYSGLNRSSVNKRQNLLLKIAITFSFWI